MARTPTLTAFGMQAAACDDLGSPFTARLCRLAEARLPATPGPVAERILDWPGESSHRGDALPLRFTAGLHALVLSGAAPGLAAVYPPHDAAVDDDTLWNAVGAALAEHAFHLKHWLDSPPQTNEVRRSAALWLGLMAVTRETGLPLVLSEIGASAGLNLNLDRYSYRFGGTLAGAAGSPLALAPEWRGAEPATAEVVVSERRGCDLNPLSPGDPDDRLRLLSYLWADQSERLALTRAAFEIAAAHPVTVERRDAAGFVAERLAAAPAGNAHVIAHSIMWQYMPRPTRAAIRDALEAAGAGATPERPLAWLRLEPDDAGPGAALDLTLWPGGGEARRERQLARCDFHGRWIEAAPAGERA